MTKYMETNMCDTGGCNVTHGNSHLVTDNGKLSRTDDGRSAITVLKNLLTENDHQAAHNRQHFDQKSILAINLMSSPGAGKTALLEATIDALGDEFSIAVIEGDLETENDAQRIRDKGVPALQISTGSACHLDAHMVHDALHHLDLNGIDIVFIENVGNLVCPASFDLGQHRNITLLSVTEGDDEAPMLRLAARRSIDIDSWLNWLRNEVKAQRKRIENNQTLRPAIQPEGAILHADHSHDHHHTHSQHKPHSHT
jgi:hydrogenase nickel incorporation protein HypB